MKIEDIVNAEFLTGGSRLLRLLPLITKVCLGLTQLFIFTVVPNEQVMGAVQRIFYFHVAAAFSSYLMIAVLLVGSSFYLLKRKMEWDALAESAASIGLLFCTIVLLSGMIWGHSAWNTWWRWEPRLVTSLILWMILLSYALLRQFSRGSGTARLAAVLGIVASVNVPVVIFSIQLLQQSEQLHPQVIAKQGLRDPSFGYGLLFATISFFLFSVWLITVRITNRLLVEERNRLEQEMRVVRSRRTARAFVPLRSEPSFQFPSE